MSWIEWTALVSAALNLAATAWAWRRGTRFYRAHRMLCEICLMAWTLRRDPRLAQHYINTVGRWWIEGGRQ